MKTRVMLLQENIYYIQSEVLLMVLTMVNLVDARAPYVCLSLGGILLILFCVQSVWEEKERFFNLLRFPLTIGYYISGGCFLSALMFYEYRICSRSWVRITMRG